MTGLASDERVTRFKPQTLQRDVAMADVAGGSDVSPTWRVAYSAGDRTRGLVEGECVYGCVYAYSERAHVLSSR